MLRQDAIVLSHWYHLFEGMQEPSQNFKTKLIDFKE